MNLIKQVAGEVLYIFLPLLAGGLVLGIYKLIN